MRVRVEKVKPEDAPGPITEGVTVIKGVRVSLPDADYSQRPYPGLFKGRPLAVLFKAEGFVEEPNLFGDYYTAVCFWDDYMGRGTFGVLGWACEYGDESKIAEVGGQRYYIYWLNVIPERGRYLYLVQYPKELSKKNCEAIGAEFTGNEGVPMCSFDYRSPYWAQESMGAWIKASSQLSSLRTRTLVNDDGLKVVSANLGDRELKTEIVCITPTDCFPVVIPNDHYWKFNPRDPRKWPYLWKDLLKRKHAHIYMFQEMIVESYYCRSQKIDAPNQHFCNGREPRTNYMEEALRAAFGANWRDHWDYVCKAYECIVVNTDVVKFVDKNDPQLTRYVSFRKEGDRVVIGDENDEDSGILLANVYIKGKNGTWRQTIISNDHLRTPADFQNGALLRKAALEYQNTIMLNFIMPDGVGYQRTVRHSDNVAPLISSNSTIPVIKCGDMNINYDTSIFNASSDTRTLLTSLALACPPDARPVNKQSSMQSPYMLVGRDRYTSAHGGGMLDVCATTGEYTGTRGLASKSGTSWDGVNIDHNAIQSVLNYFEDGDSVDVTIKLCPKLRDRAGFSDFGSVNVPTCAWIASSNLYAIFKGPLNLPVHREEDGNLHILVPKSLYEQGFLLNKVSNTSPGLVPKGGKYSCSRATGRCCLSNDFYTPSQPYLSIMPGKTEYELCY